MSNCKSNFLDGKKNSYQCGAVAIEMVIALTVTLFLFMACAEMARAIFQYNELTKAVRSATRYLSENALNPAGAKEFSAEAVGKTKSLILFSKTSDGIERLFPNLQAEHITVTYEELGLPSVTVSVEWPYVSLFQIPIPTFNFGESLKIEQMVLKASLSSRALN